MKRSETERNFCTVEFLHSGIKTPESKPRNKFQS